MLITRREDFEIIGIQIYDIYLYIIEIQDQVSVDKCMKSRHS